MERQRYAFVLTAVCLVSTVGMAGCAGWGADGPADANEPGSNEDGGNAAEPTADDGGPSTDHGDSTTERVRAPTNPSLGTGIRAPPSIPIRRFRTRRTMAIRTPTPRRPSDGPDDSDGGSDSGAGSDADDGDGAACESRP